MPHDYRADDVMPEELDRVIDDMGDSIGNGKHSKTYALNSDPTVAVKEIDFDDVPNCNKEVVAANLRRLILLSHPNLVEYHWSGLTEYCAYVKMERCDTSLEDMIRRMSREGKQSEHYVCNVLRDVANALKYLHSENSISKHGITNIPEIVHGNLKPDNVLFREKTGTFAITALDLEFRDMSNRPKVGTLVYMSPERLLGKEYGPPADIWSLGMIAFTLMTGKPLIDKDSVIAQIFTDSWNPDLDAINNDDIRRIIKRMLAIRPEARISASDLIDSLSNINYDAKPISPLQNVIPSSPSGEKVRSQSSQLIQSSISSQNDISQIWGGFASPQGNAAPKQNIFLDDFASPRVEEVLRSPMSQGQSHGQQYCPNNIIDATIMGDINAIRNMVSSGADLSARSSLGKTPLMCAIEAGREDIALLLIDCYKGIQDDYKATALMYAAKNNMLNVAKLLISDEAGEQDDIGWTALMYAADNGRLEMVRLLADHEYAIRSNKNRTAATYAKARNHSDIVDFLSNYGVSAR